VNPMARRFAIATILAIAATAAILPAAAGPAVALVPGVPQGFRPLTIKTLPPIAGVRVKFDNSVLVTGPDGTVRTLISKEQRDELVANRDAHLQMISTNVDMTPTLRGRFHGWYQEGYVFTPQNPVGEVEIATFDLDALTRFTFVDRHHAALDARGITDMQVRNSLGGLTDIGKPKPVWLRAAIVTSVGGKVVLKDVEWRLASVTFHQTNIVQRGAQHFTPRHAPQVAVKVNVYTVEFHALDAFFGSPKGKTLKLTLPDGSIRMVALHNGRATVAQLPSGDYDVLIDARGLGKDQSITVSNDASIDLKVLSLTDIALVLVILALLVGGVLLLGLRVRRRRRARGLGDRPDTIPRSPAVLVGPDDR